MVRPEKLEAIALGPAFLDTRSSPVLQNPGSGLQSWL